MSLSSSSPPPRSSSNNSLAAWLPYLVIFLAIALVIQSVTMNLRYWNSRRNVPADARPITPRGDLAQDEKTTIDLFRKASKSVVYITTITVGRDFSMNLLEIPKGTGTGFVWDDQGHVVTNFHVIRGGNRVRVTLADQTSWDAQFVGGAPERDLAVLKIDAPVEGLAALDIGESSTLDVGQKVFAIGNPFGLDQTLTTGIVSGLGRQLPTESGTILKDLIQTDAAINPGNSGGPLLDSAGRLIGVNTAIYSPSGVSSGVGFAIPVDAVQRVVPQLISRGEIKHADIGARYLPSSRLPGALVAEVGESSAAKKAGLVPLKRRDDGTIELGDLIIGVEQMQVTSARELLLALQQYDVGQTVTLTVLRDPSDKSAKPRQVKVTLQEAE
jgi:S1-C subfamily serine protease